MKIITTNILMAIAILISLECLAQNTITSDDLKKVVGEWTGNLTYMDYTTKKPFTMPANLTVSQGKNGNQLLLFNSYPNEPKANNKNKIRISKDGRQIDGNYVKSIENLANGDVQITTEYSGKDNNKEALIRNIYILGTSHFVIRKEVKFENSEKWFVRNEYNYSR